MSGVPLPVKHDNIPVDDDALPPTSALHPVNDISETHTNGHVKSGEEEARVGSGEDAVVAEQRPAKKRKLDDVTSRSHSISRAVSPPWKAVVAEGPTTVIVDGKRKSTRFNPSTPEAPPESEKRKTRAAVTNTVNGSNTKVNGHRIVSTPLPTKSNKPYSSLRRTPSTAFSKATPQSPSQRTRKPSDAKHSDAKPAPTRANGEVPVKRGPGRPRKHPLPETPVVKKERRYRKSDVSDLATPDGCLDDSAEDMPPPSGKTPRLKLRLRRPDMIQSSPFHIPQKKFGSLAELLEADDPLADEAPGTATTYLVPRTAEQVNHEVNIRLRIAEAAENGVLSRERSKVWQTEPAEEPPKIYGHYEYVVAHALHFGKLLRKEKEEHRRLAKRLAQEAVERWTQKYKKVSKEEREREELKDARIRHKQLLTDLEQSWRMAKAEVDNVRLARWQEEQDRQGKEVMENMVDQAKMVLGQRRLDNSESVAASEEGTEDGESDVEGSTDDEDHFLSESEDDEEDDGNDADAILTAEELRAKYEHVPDLPKDDASESEEEGDVEVQSTVDAEDQASRLEQDDDNMQDVDDASEMDLVEDKIPPDQYEALTEPITPRSTGTPKPRNGIHLLVSAEGKPVDYSALALEEVDEALLDSEDADASESGSEAWSDDDEDESEVPVSESDEDAEDEEGNATLGFLADAEIERIKKENKAALQADIVNANGVGDDENYSDTDARSDTRNGVNGGHADPDAHNQEQSPAPIQNGHTIADRTRSPSEKLNGASGPTVHENMNGVHAETDDDVEEMDVATSQQKQVSRSMSRASSSLPRVEIPTILLRGTLREYQHDGLDWLANLYDGNTNGILADEMGLGKTIQTISLLAHLALKRNNWGPHLVVVPTSVMLNWEMEFKKWCPGFKILTYYGDIKERANMRKGWRNDDLYNVIITSYQLIIQDQAAFKMRAWQYLILDEAHNIKNFKTQRWQTLLGFRTTNRLLLTGTPLQNNIDELWSLLYFLMPAGFEAEGKQRIADLEDFANALKNPTNQILEQGKQVLDAQGQKIVKKLHEVLRPYLLRRLKCDVEKQMPGKYEHIVYCRLSKRQRQLYDGFLGRADTKATLATGNYMSIINCLMSLRKVCNHPDLFETRQIVTSFAMRKSVVADFEIKDLLVRKRLLAGMEDEKVDLDFLNLSLARRESKSRMHAMRTQKIRAVRPLEDLIEQQTRRITALPQLDGMSVNSVLSYMTEQEKMSNLDQLKSSLRLTRQRTQFLPVYGKGLRDRLDCRLQDKLGTRAPRRPIDAASWYLNTSSKILDIVPTLEQRAASLNPIITKFGCVTPAVVATDLAPLTLSLPGTDLVRASPLAHTPSDPFHEPRIRLSIAFPDKRLLQYDCGKLQRLALLLRDLQAGGHRALIFTQMTRVLDILEQFLNIHGHRYLRLDGATKVEQRQILTDRFNSDPRILCFILSSRSGGLGINLTGADTVIFYDLDWNPAMDKQCQDRCHRIGQTRDVHIYKFVSEYTIEANILRKSNQKRLLDDVIIQKGDFTTDYFNRVTWRDAFDEIGAGPVDDAAKAMERVLGDEAALGDVILSVEDQEDAAAAKVAQKEIVEEEVGDEADFNGVIPPTTGPNDETAEPVGVATDGKEVVEVGGKKVRIGRVDDYMYERVLAEWGNVPYEYVRKERKRAKKGVDPHRVRKRRV
jgi:helicase SWR1